MNSKSCSSNPEEGGGQRVGEEPRNNNKNKQKVQKTNNKIADLSRNISIISLNVNVLNIPIKDRDQ